MRGERRQMFLHDYPELYCATERDDLIFQQRSQIVHWIVEQLTKKEFELETMSLGVSLLDRFLTKGFFKNKRHLRIFGIVCLSLATRIEENQPYNCVRQENFYIGNNMYSRCKVVHGHGMAGAGGPYLPMFLAHHPQLHVVTPFPSSHALYLMQVVRFVYCLGHEQRAQLVFFHITCSLGCLIEFCPFPMLSIRFYMKAIKRARYLGVLALSDHEQLMHWPSTATLSFSLL